MNNRHAQYTERVIRHSNIRKPYQGVPDTANTVVSKQLKLIDCLITQLENHGLYSNTMVGGWSNYTYRISLKKTKYPNSRIEIIRVNFNRFNLALHLIDHTGDLHLGTVRFKTTAGDNDGTEGCVTSPFHFTNDDDAKMLEELKIAFYETEQIYSTTECDFEMHENTDKIDLNTITFVDLCKMYCSNLSLSTRLSSHMYENYKLSEMTAMDFYNKIDLVKLANIPGIGPKSITIIKNMYVFYDFKVNQNE